MELISRFFLSSNGFDDISCDYLNGLKLNVEVLQIKVPYVTVESSDLT